MLFVEKPGKWGKFRMVTDFKEVNKCLWRPGWPFPSADKVRKSLNPEDRCFLKIDLCEGYHQLPIREEDNGNVACPWG